MNYNDLTRRHFEAAKGAGVLAGPDVRRGYAGSLRLGTWVQFDLRFQLAPAPGAIQQGRFLAFGCPHVIAVADWIVLHAVGLTEGSSLPEPVPALQERFAVPIEKLGRLLVIEDAWIAAIAPPS